MHRAVLWDPWLAEYEDVEAWIWRSQGSGGREGGRERESMCVCVCVCVCTRGQLLNIHRFSTVQRVSAPDPCFVGVLFPILNPFY